MSLRITPEDRWRQIGEGTLNNPKIVWLMNRPSNQGRVDGCEEVAREISRLQGFTQIWIRHIDHATTRTKVNGRRVLRDTDPHITVYFGNEPGVATHGADVFLVYNNGKPARMARTHELRKHRGRNPAMNRT